MTSSSKLTFGIILGIAGYLLFLCGLLLSFSLIGACIGIPMALIGLPLGIWGSVWMWQGKVQRAEEAIATGVRQGIQQATTPPMPPPTIKQSAPIPPQDSK